MTDDLVKRLRDRDAYAKIHGWENVVFGQAAYRIEELQKQLAASDEEIRALRDQIENLEYKIFGMENHT